MRDLTLTISSAFEKKRSSSSISHRAVNLVILVLIVVSGFAYLFIVNTIGTKGYEIRKLETQLKQLETEQKQLQIQSSDSQSINKIQLDAAKLNFTPATNVTYLKDSDFAFK